MGNADGDQLCQKNFFHHFGPSLWIVGLVLPIELHAAGDSVILAWKYVIFFKWESLRVIGAKNSPQIGMAGEVDAEHVVGLFVAPIVRRA